MFEEILSTFENDDIKVLAEECIADFPDYFWHVGASSTGKYHPEYACGEGGLYRHTLALCRILNHILTLDSVKNRFTSRSRDLMRLAGIVHDSRKSGDQDDYEKNKYTKHNHPILAAHEVCYKRLNTLSNDEKKLLHGIIASHMGQWNTSKRDSVVLPVPSTPEEILVHMCDYLASRKDIILTFEEEKHPIMYEHLVSLDTFVMPFGKHKGTLFKELPMSYVEWLNGRDLSNFPDVNGMVKERLGKKA